MASVKKKALYVYHFSRYVSQETNTKTILLFMVVKKTDFVKNSTLLKFYVTF
jgi:hypothetical protein